MNENSPLPETQSPKPKTKTDMLIGCLKRHWHGLRWTALFILMAYGLASCDAGRKLVLIGSQLFTGSPSYTYTDFPLGQHKQVDVNVRSYAKHRFCIYMRTEFIDGKIKRYGSNALIGEYQINQQVAEDQDAFIGMPTNTNQRQFYTFQVTVYKQGWWQEEVFFRKNYTNLSIRENIAPSHGDNTSNPRNEAYQQGVECFDLPYGKYRFEFVDNSPPISEFKEVMTAVGVRPDISLK